MNLLKKNYKLEIQILIKIQLFNNFLTFKNKINYPKLLQFTKDIKN